MSSRKNLEGGRVAQKRRTRQALLDAALRVIRRGEEPTLDGIAAEADVSRATTYRYFPRLEALLAVLPLADLVADPATVLGPDPEADPAAAALRVQRYFLDLSIDNERAFRRLIQANLEEMLRDGADDETGPVRGGYRPRMLAQALAPLEARGVDVTHLRTALVALSGIEALIAVKDVCGLDDDESREALGWAARTLLEAAQR